MATRNLALEQNALKTYTKTTGKLPSTAEDWKSLHTMAYGSDLPDEFKTAVTTSAQGTGAQSATIAPPATNADGTPALSELQTQQDEAGKRVQDLSGGNEALRVLQEAIKTKAGTRQAPIGESAIFKQAGVGGIGALSASLSSRGEEINTNMADFKNVISQMSGTYKDRATTAMFNYENASKAYTAEKDRLEKIEEESRAYEKQIKLLKIQHDNAIELENLQKSTPTIGDRINAWQGGYIFDENGNPQADVSQASADDVANAILTVESGGNFNAKGGSGENGQFQFMPATWNIVSQQYAQANGLNQSLQMTQENEDKVARWKIGQLLESGNTPEQVALIWNGSLGGSEKAVKKSGTNDKGISYDTGAYANKVMNVLRKNATQIGGGSSSDMDIANQLVKGDILLSDITARMGKSESDKIKYLKLALQLDPTFSVTANKQRNTFQTQWNNPQGKTFTSRNAINTALGHLAELKTASDQLKASGIPKFNDLKNWLSKNTGNPAANDYNYILNQLSTEIASAYKGGVPDKAEIERNYDALSSGLSSEQFDSVFTKAANLLASKVSALGDQYKGTMGVYPDDPIIQNYALEELKNAGVNTSKIEELINRQTGKISESNVSSSSSSPTSGTLPSGISYEIVND